jgi:hypothetical protein
MEKKKAWSKPEVRRLAVTDRLLDLIALSAKSEAPMPVKRPK